MQPILATMSTLPFQPVSGPLVAQPTQTAKPKPPKRALTAYNWFFKDQLQEFSKLNKKDKKTKTKVTEFISALWNKAPMSVRTRYFDMAMQDKFRYYREKSEYEEDLERWQLQQQQQQQQQVVLNNESTSSNRSDVDGDDSDTSVPEIYDPLSSSDAISHLADQLDARSIDFLVRAFK